MRIGRILILLALVLIVGLAAVYLLYLQPSQTATPSGPQPTQEVPKVKVVISAQPIRRGTRIEENMLAEVEVPADSVVQSQILDPNEALGKLAARDIPQGLFLTKGDLAESPTALGETGSTAALAIPPGYVAISIPISRLTSVAYAIRPGDHVALLATLPIVEVDQDFQSRLPNVIQSAIQTSGEGQFALTPLVETSGGVLGKVVNDEELGTSFYVGPSEPQRPRLTTQMFIEDALVLYVGTFPLTQAQPQVVPTSEQPAQGAPSPQEQVATEQQAVQPPDIVTLVVSPEDAVALKHLMDRQIVLTLALRAPGDTQPLNTEAVTLSYIIDRYRFVIPAKLPYDTEPRIDKIEMPVLPNDVQLTPQP